MAKNYTIGEAAQVIYEGKDHESILDLGRRYPLLTTSLAKLVSRAGEEFVDFMGFIPEYVSANKVNSQMKKQLLDEEATPKKVEKAAPKKAASKKAAVEDDEDDDSIYASMKGKQLNELLDQVGGRKKCQKEFGDCKNGSMIKFLEKYYPNGVDVDGDDDDEEDGYESMSEAELFKLCKSRGITAQKGKKAKYYIGLLEKADAAGEAEEDDDEDEWEEVEKPKKAPKKAEKKAKKAPKKEEPEDVDDDDEDDDDWDI